MNDLTIEQINQVIEQLKGIKQDLIEMNESLEKAVEEL